MASFLSQTLWKELLKAAKYKGKKQIAVGYTSSLEGIPLTAGDTLITDASEATLRTGQTDAAVLADAADRKVRIFDLPGLHAKVYIFPYTTVIGSANLSQNSRNLTEAAVVSRDRRLRAEAKKWFESMLQRARKLSETDLSRMKKIPVTRWGGGPGNANRPTLLEALETNAPILMDFSYSWLTEAPDLPNALVTKAAKKADALPPGLKSDDWTWSEWPDSPGLKKQLDSAYNGRENINFFGKSDKDGILKRFTSIDPLATIYMRSIRIHYRGAFYRVVLWRIQNSTPGLSLKGKSWRPALCRILTNGLKKQPGLRKKLSERTNSQIKLSEIRALYNSGRGSS